MEKFTWLLPLVAVLCQSKQTANKQVKASECGEVKRRKQHVLVCTKKRNTDDLTFYNQVQYRQHVEVCWTQIFRKANSNEENNTLKRRLLAYPN